MLDPKEDFYPHEDCYFTTYLTDKHCVRHGIYSSVSIYQPTSKGIYSYEDLVDQIKPFMKLVANELEMPEFSNYIFNVIFSVDVFFFFF